MNSTAGSENFLSTDARGAGKKKISHGFCVKQRQRLCITGAGEGLSDNEGVVATFFLMRYQSVVASRSEINFARQLFRISLFIFAVQQNFRDPLPEGLRCDIALDSAPVANGNAACLFGDDYRDGIRFLSYSEPGAMT